MLLHLFPQKVFLRLQHGSPVHRLDDNFFFRRWDGKMFCEPFHDVRYHAIGEMFVLFANPMNNCHGDFSGHLSLSLKVSSEAGLHTSAPSDLGGSSLLATPFVQKAECIANDDRESIYSKGRVQRWMGKKESAS